MDQTLVAAKEATWPCVCGETLYTWHDPGDARTLAVRHGENPEHYATVEQLRERYGEVAVWAEREISSLGEHRFDAGGGWLVAVHERAGYRHAT